MSDSDLQGRKPKDPSRPPFSPITPDRGFLIRRAVLALVLTVGFYLLAVAVAALLAALPVVEWYYLRRVHWYLLAFGFGGAWLILSAIFPKRQQFHAPGPKLDEQKHPKLFKLIRETAAHAGQDLPQDVYLVPEINAFVSERGGFLGLGRRRLLGLGLPLLGVLSVSEVKAVLAHEFGHFASGDTKLGGWVYRTSAALIQTVRNLGGRHQVVQMLFIAYAKMFLRLTNAVSRQQEFYADRLAAKLAGRRPLVEGLHKLEGQGAAFEVFWRREFLPLLGAGFRTPLIGGFANFSADPEIAKNVKDLLASEAGRSADEYDTHPTLHERQQAVTGLHEVVGVNEKQSALSLLTDPEKCEQEVVEFLFKPGVPKPELVGWDQVGELVYKPQWRELQEPFEPLLTGIPLLRLRQVALNPGPLLGTIMQVTPERLSQQGLSLAVLVALARSLALNLAERGWTLVSEMAGPVVVTRDKEKIDPLKLVRSLALDEQADADWQRRCKAEGWGRLNMGHPGQDVAKDEYESRYLKVEPAIEEWKPMYKPSEAEDESEPGPEVEGEGGNKTPEPVAAAPAPAKLGAGAVTAILVMLAILGGIGLSAKRAIEELKSKQRHFNTFYTSLIEAAENPVVVRSVGIKAKVSVGFSLPKVKGEFYEVSYPISGLDGSGRLVVSHVVWKEEPLPYRLYFEKTGKPRQVVEKYYGLPNTISDYLKEDNLTAAQELCKYGLQLDPEDWDVYTARAVVHNKMKQEDKELEDLNTALAGDPDQLEAHRMRAYLYGRRKAYDKAVRDMWAAAVQDPKDLQICYDLAALCEMAGKKADMRAALNAANTLERDKGFSSPEVKEARENYEKYRKKLKVRGY
jgi:heat shock protein HtpX